MATWITNLNTRPGIFLLFLLLSRGLSFTACGQVKSDCSLLLHCSVAMVLQYISGCSAGWREVRNGKNDKTPPGRERMERKSPSHVISACLSLVYTSPRSLRCDATLWGWFFSCCCLDEVIRIGMSNRPRWWYSWLNTKPIAIIP